MFLVKSIRITEKETTAVISFGVPSETGELVVVDQEVPASEEVVVWIHQLFAMKRAMSHQEEISAPLPVERVQNYVKSLPTSEYTDHREAPVSQNIGHVDRESILRASSIARERMASWEDEDGVESI